LIAC